VNAPKGDSAAGGPPDGRIVLETAREWWRFWAALADLGKAGLQLLTFGSHSTRPQASDMPNGAIYVESDRSGVIYQNQGGDWHFLAGTMWGTLNPDERPTDLGVNDAGFDFRSTDSNPVYTQREYIWSGTAWIETTIVQYGPHTARPTSANAPVRALYVETDRSEVLYQNQPPAWHFIAGTMWGTLVPDQRPTDLGVNDAGFAFRGTDAPRSFIWSGTAWVETTPPAATPANLALLSIASANLTLTLTPQNVPGLSLTLPRAGVYLITGVFYFSLVAGDAGATLVGQFSANTSSVAALANFIVGATTVQIAATVTQQWLYTATAGQVITLQAYKSSGTGTSNVAASHSSISALWVSP
jgi:hypothetical protein